MFVPAIGQTLSRKLMPQIDDHKAFLDDLTADGISHSLETLRPNSIRSTQLDFDPNKILSLQQQNGEMKPIITSNDGYVLDGHHRWMAAFNNNTEIKSHVVQLPILELLARAKRHLMAEAMLAEGTLEYKEYGPMLDSFVKFASDQLGLKSYPAFQTKSDDDDFNSFACYDPSDNKIIVQLAGRSFMDAMRSVAHELTHAKQNQDGRLYDGAGETGTPIEDEANAMAGRIMRHWAKSNPEHFKHNLKEAIFVVGGPMSGKDRFARQLTEIYNATEIDLDRVKTLDWKNVEGNVVISVSADNISEEFMSDAKAMFEKYRDYGTSVYFIETTNEISKLRNEARAERGQRVLSEGLRFEKFSKAQVYKEKLASLFENFVLLDNSVQITEAAAKPKKKAKKKPSSNKMNITLSVGGSNANTDKSKPSPSTVKAEKEAEANSVYLEKLSMHHAARASEFASKASAIQNAMGRLQPEGKNFKEVHKQLRLQLAGALLGLRKYQKQSVDVHKPIPKPPKPVKKKKIDEAFKELLETGGAGEWGTHELRAKYQKDTPGQDVKNFVQQTDPLSNDKPTGVGDVVDAGFPTPWTMAPGTISANGLYEGKKMRQIREEMGMIPDYEGENDPVKTASATSDSDSIDTINNKKTAKRKQ